MASLPKSFKAMSLYRNYEADGSGGLASSDAYKEITWTKNPDGTYSGNSASGGYEGKISAKEAQRYYSKPIGAQAGTPKQRTPTATEKDVAKIREWLKTQSADKQSRLGDMLEKGLVKEVKAELPAGWANKNPAQGAPKTEGSAKATGTKLKSVDSNPAAKATKDAVAAEVKAADKKPVSKKTGSFGKGAQAFGKGLMSKAGARGLGIAGSGLILGADAIGRAGEISKDLDEGKSLGEAINKPESNWKLYDQAEDLAATAAGAEAGTYLGGAIGALGGPAAPFTVPLGMVVGGVGGGFAGKPVKDFVKKVGKAALFGPQEPKQANSKASNAPAGNAPSIGIEEASNWLKQKGMDPSADNFQKAFEELSKKQQEQINKTPEPKPSADTYKPSAKESVAMAEQAVKAPIGMQDKAPEPDIMSFLSNPDTQGMIAELAAKQANRVQSAGNIPDFKPRKKNEDDEDGMSPSSTTTANVRPPPRFFVNTGRFGTMAGGGSRRSPSGRLL